MWDAEHALLEIAIQARATNSFPSDKAYYGLLTHFYVPIRIYV